MNVATSPPAAFASLVEEYLGLHSEVPTNRAWADILTRRLDVTRSATFESYRQRFSSSAARCEEVSELARLMTVGETYFFRDAQQFEALTTVLLPELFDNRANGTKVRVLCVASSTGEEPYSVAIAARELLGSRADLLQILAFDINPQAISAAKRGTYSEWALRATPIAVRDRYFHAKGNQFTLSSTIRDAVQFEVRNLFEPDVTFWKPGQFDLVFCRNALIYFSRRKIAEALNRFAEVLAPGGTLLLGNAETPRGYDDRFVAREVCATFCYRLEEKAVHTTLAPTGAILGTEVEAVVKCASSSTPNDGADWVSAIGAAATRLTSLAQSNPAPRSTSASSSLSNVEERLADARQLTHGERFDEALRTLDQIVASGHESSDVHVLRASILTNQGRFAESVDLCLRLLSDDPYCAAAHHLLAVAYEQLGKLVDARLHHEKAIVLDPRFTMSHWLLGRLCLRVGERSAARRHLSLALELWQTDTGSSNRGVDIYSGGFNRETLERLCRADLAKCGGLR